MLGVQCSPHVPCQAVFLKSRLDGEPRDDTPIDLSVVIDISGSMVCLSPVHRVLARIAIEGLSWQSCGMGRVEEAGVCAPKLSRTCNEPFCSQGDPVSSMPSGVWQCWCRRCCVMEIALQ